MLLDINLNSINGLDALKEIREHYPHLLVILMTGNRDEVAEAVESVRKNDAYTCIYKHFKIEELLQLLTEIHYKRE